MKMTIERFRRLTRARSGNSTIEFALTGPLFLLIMIVLVELGGMALAQGLLDDAVSQASRAGSTGYTPKDGSREGYIREIVAREAGVFLDPARIGVTTTTHDSFADIGNGSGTAGPGDASEVVVYRVTYEWLGLTRLLEKITGAISLSATMAVRNEPF